MPIRIDFTGVSSSGNFEALEEGNYSAKISSVKQDVSKAGNPMLTIEFTLTEPAGRKMWRYFALTPNALWALKGFLEDLEFDLPQDGEFDFDETELVGEEVILEIGQKPHYQDPNKLDNEILSIHRG